MQPRRSKRLHQAILAIPPLPPPPAEAPPRAGFRFTRLPAEIRNAIYSLVLVQNRTLKPDVPTLFKEAEKRERTKEPFTSHETTLALARTCKQIHDEVIPIFFGRNTFRFMAVYELYQFLYMIGYERRRYLQSIEVFLVGTRRYYLNHRRRRVKGFSLQRIEEWAFDLLADSTVLKSLCLGVTGYNTIGPHGTVIHQDHTPDSVIQAFLAKHDLDVKIVGGMVWQLWK